MLCVIEALENVIIHRRQFRKRTEERCRCGNFAAPVRALDDLRERFIGRTAGGPQASVRLEVN